MTAASNPDCDSLAALTTQRMEALEYRPADRLVANQAHGHWSLAALSLRGSGHSLTDAPRQDHFSYAFVRQTVIACVADGLGSQARSHVGAKIVAEQVVRELAVILESIPSKDIPEQLCGDDVARLAPDIRSAVSRAAREIEALSMLAPGPGLATTLLGVLATERAGLFFQVGDGVMLACTRPLASATLPVMLVPEALPQKHLTHAVSPDPLDGNLRFRSFGMAEQILMMTDGAADCLASAMSGDGTIGPCNAGSGILSAIEESGGDGSRLLKRMEQTYGNDINVDDDMTLLVISRCTADPEHHSVVDPPRRQF